MPERIVDIEGQVRWEGRNSAWDKLLRRDQDIPRTCGCRGNSCIVRQGCTTISFGIF
ncbi:hypothetical protein PO609_18585 [Enterobacter cloacae]